MALFSSGSLYLINFFSLILISSLERPYSSLKFGETILIFALLIFRCDYKNPKEIPNVVIVIIELIKNK